MLTIKSIIQMGQSLNMILLAEGVETSAKQDATMIQSGCSRFQGYLLSKPKPIDEKDD
jgi:EAL domain-containing protein (putative c-di-GMP-specific phosphodiesterase class I)